MKDIPFLFTDSGEVTVNGELLRWTYHITVMVRLHERSEMFSCVELGDNCMSLHDLKGKLHRMFRAGAKAATRRKYTAELDRRQKVRRHAT